MKRSKPNKTESQAGIARQLQRYQQKITNILESFTDAFFEVDCKWTVTYWNAEAERLLSMSREEVLGKNLWEMYPDAVPLKFYTEYHRALNNHVAVRFEEYFHPKKIWIEVAAFPSGEGLSVYFKDITEAKQTKQILEEERKKYHDLFNLSSLPQWVYDFETLKFLQVNEAAIHHYGYSREEFLTMTIMDIRPREALAELHEIIQTKVKTGRYNRSIVQHQKKNGDIIFVQVEGNAVTFEDKNARLAQVIDLTEKIIAEKELQQSLNRYDIVSKATSDAIWDWDIKTDTVNWNKGIEGIFGHQNVEFSFNWRRDHVHPDDLVRVTTQFEKLISNRKSRHQIEYRFRCADGTYKTILDRSFILFDEQGKAVRVIGSMQDISERIRIMQEIEAQNIRLREISWIQAHEVRAPVAKLLGLSELIDSKPTPPLKDILDLSRMIHLSAVELDQAIKSLMKKSQ